MSTTDQTAAIARAVDSIAVIVARQADRGALDVHDRAVLERSLGVLRDGAPTLELIAGSYLAAGPGARLVLRERDYGGHEALIVTDKGSVRSTTSISSPATAEALQPLAGRHGAS